MPRVNMNSHSIPRRKNEYEKCLVGLTAITREACNTAQQTEDKREKIQALSLAKECYSMKLDLLTNATTVVDDAIRFVSDRSKNEEKLKSSIANDDTKQDKEESKEPDYDEDKDLLEEQEEKAGDITTAITNQVF